MGTIPVGDPPVPARRSRIPTPASSRGRRETRPTAVLTVLALAGVGSALMHTILVPLQAELPELLGADRADTAWAITITILVSAIITPVAGRLGDMFGKRLVCVLLLAVLTVGSVICALSTDMAPFLVGRGLQGSGAGMIGLGIALLRELMPARRLGSAIALLSATQGLGGALGLPLSAWMNAHFSFQDLFWVSALIGGVSTVLLLVLVPESASRTGGRFDWLGTVLFAAGLVALLLAITRGGLWGWSSAPTLGALSAAVLALALWTWWELRTPHGLVDLRLNVRRTVLLANTAGFALGFALYVSQISTPQFLQLSPAAGGLGLDQQGASFVLMALGLSMLAVAPLSGRLLLRLGPRNVNIVGSAVVGAAFLAAALLDLQVWHMVLITAGIGVGIAWGFAATPLLVMSAVPVSATGSANGLSALVRSLGTTMSAAATGAVLAAMSTALGEPTLEGFRATFAMALGAAAVSAVLASFVPRGTGSLRTAD